MECYALMNDSGEIVKLVGFGQLIGTIEWVTEVNSLLGNVYEIEAI